jgi:sterol desaturase/sphingolipid hydroxylase (fatty acid hydroxylase superfamily)
MDDLRFGTRNKGGDYTPNSPLRTGPLLAWPPRPWAVLRWLPGYFLPWNLMFFALRAALWFWLTPAKAVMQSYAWGWVLWIWARNTLLVAALYGAMELRLYLRRAQGNRFKYKAKFRADAPSDVFWFKSQNLDNILRSFGTGLPIWSAYEVFLLHAWANGDGPWTTFAAHPWALAIFALALPLIHEVHFNCIHRLIHVPILYKYIHSVHHNSINPSPWSSLSMHPVEHLLYWSDSLIHLVIPSRPLLVLYHLNVTGTGAVVGHVGFDKIETGPDSAFDSHAFAHYLHHKYFEVNYADGTIPLDRWFGTWHDGSKSGEALMQARFEHKKARLNAGKEGDSK